MSTGSPKVEITAILDTAIQQGASDIHLRVGKPPTLRIHGQLRELKTMAFTPEMMVSAMRGIAPETAQQEVSEKGKLGSDFAREYGGARFRCSLFRERGQLGMVLRRLPSTILTPEQIGFPSEVLALLNRPRGLFLVTGPTGSGKSTTLACFVDYLQRQVKNLHTITIEEPMEYTYQVAPGAIVTQREVPHDTPSFAEGLRQALRQDPDVIVVGEMRDLETTRTAISAAETGHLVFGTLHTVSAAKTIDRLVEQFPGPERAQVRSQVSTCLLGVLCQQLLPRKDGAGRIPAFEFMECVSAISNLIRTEKTEAIESTIQTSGKSRGMQLLDDHLHRLVVAGHITKGTALEFASNPEKLGQRLKAL